MSGKYTAKTVILGLIDSDQLIGGYSFKLQKVYFTRKPEKAKKFTPVQAQNFMVKYVDEQTDFHWDNIQLFLTKPGQGFKLQGENV